MRCVKLSGTSPPQNVGGVWYCRAWLLICSYQNPVQELFLIVKQELQRWCPLSRPVCTHLHSRSHVQFCVNVLLNFKWQAFQDNVEQLLAEGKLVRANQDTGSLRIAGADTAGANSAAGGR